MLMFNMINSMKIIIKNHDRSYVIPNNLKK